ncbi:hypothetical protein [Catenovulum sediminis]|uniref:hypothetical protein n=1 Tax=Catenovulum sediminis TaxID=1740262 RepID=UPI00163D4C08|nr:hypothetical protein [Catenovulum sediminis]
MNTRLFISATVAFIFYFAWSYWANLSAEIAIEKTLQSALVQASYSAFVTLFFTLILEKVVSKFERSYLSLAFITPILCKVHSQTPQNKAIFRSFSYALEQSACYFKGKQLAGVIFAPLIPLSIQSILVISVNLINQTPNLWLTIAPSIFFTALYGYSYTFTLLKPKPKPKPKPETRRN